jgi:probable HAF family extracellular repeat protein
MKKNLTVVLALISFFAPLAITAQLAAQEHKDHQAEQRRYKFIDLGTLGGPAAFLTEDSTGSGSSSGILNRQGTVVSSADTSMPDPNFPNACFLCPTDPFIVHAFRWDKGVLSDLGALPGVNSSFANWISENGLVAGFSENGLIDPLLGVPEIQGVLWKDDAIINLGTLEGSHQIAAFAVNNKAQVVGAFVNTIPDPFSPFGLQVRAFLWQNGVIQDLGTLGGPESVANFVNERGQVVGTAFTNSTANLVTGVPTQDPFLWDDGTMADLGTLGGTFGIPNLLDDRGRVIGQSNMAGDLNHHPFLWTKSTGMQDLGTLGGDNGQANWMNEAGEIVGKADVPGSKEHHAFIWRNGVMKDLGTLPGDPCSNAVDINSRGQVVGASDTPDCLLGRHAFLWEDSVMTDLNTLLPPSAHLQLTVAFNINDRGEIVGIGVPPGVPVQDQFNLGHVFVLVPCDEKHSDIEGCDYDIVDAAAVQNNTAPLFSVHAAAIQVGLRPSEMKDRNRALLANRNRRR